MVKPPLFCVERDAEDIAWFTARERAEHHLEAVDIPDFRFFDADGTELRLAPRGNAVRVTDEVVGEFPDQLAAALRKHLLHQKRIRKRRTLDDAMVHTASLADLVAEFTRVEKSV